MDENKMIKDGANLELFKLRVRELIPQATAVHVETSDQNRYGFIVQDVTLTNGRKLSTVLPDLLDHLCDAAWEYLSDLNWNGVVGENPQGYATISLPLTERPADSIFLFSGFFDEHALSIRSALFGYMLKLAMPVLSNYRSDLYHDALLIESTVTGAVEFDWLVRESGTNLGESATVAVRAGLTGTFYRITVSEHRLGWYATFTEVPHAEVLASL